MLSSLHLLQPIESSPTQLLASLLLVSPALPYVALLESKQLQAASTLRVLQSDQLLQLRVFIAPAILQP